MLYFPPLLPSAIKDRDLASMLPNLKGSLSDIYTPVEEKPQTALPQTALPQQPTSEAGGKEQLPQDFEAKYKRAIARVANWIRTENPSFYSVKLAVDLLSQYPSIMTGAKRAEAETALTTEQVKAIPFEKKMKEYQLAIDLIKALPTTQLPPEVITKFSEIIGKLLHSDTPEAVNEKNVPPLKLRLKDFLREE